MLASAIGWKFQADTSKPEIVSLLDIHEYSNHLQER